MQAGTQRSRAIGSNEPDPNLRGQRASHQINTLLDVECHLRDEIQRNSAQLPYFRIQNGYFSPLVSFQHLYEHFQAVAEGGQDGSNSTVATLCEKYIIAALRIGLVEDATVTTPIYANDGSTTQEALHTVSQAYCSALSLSSSVATQSTALLATSVLQGAYEGTLLFGILHALRTLERQIRDEGRSAEQLQLPTVFLTKVGGGVFNNEASWIKDAIRYGLHAVSPYGVPLDVALVHFRCVDPFYL
ncbi:hypothetical protein STCU_05021 [Strigomonas culicis]|uniref:Uncharacterized protein n=1 Tax=Strigomonas culicis TaxID=28005 RepID=S9UIK9_9TRYP|nr:hypothetical protein STCU_05021 [Strigomonas culicis]|eukprot:EPY28559.1 hypothetical protein STCU_05021 [Strigomonas culicis]